MNRIVFHLCIAFLALLFSNTLSAQVPAYQIQGPYTEYEGPYYIRVFVNYIETSGDPWTQNVDLAARTAGIIANLNLAFNQHHIFFTGHSDLCTVSDTVITGSPSRLHQEALDIFDWGGNIAAQGHEFSIPSTYCEVRGAYNGKAASHTSVLIHIVGHCLGLANTFNGASPNAGCVETGADCPIAGEPDCNCCGDFVCDTPVAPSNITVAPHCLQSIAPAGLPQEIFNNYMSQVEPLSCRDRFTTGQAQRMWTYLALAPALQGIQVQEVKYPGATPSGVCGNIVVASGHLVINSPLEMLPGATIRVKRGARLTVASTITGACGKMWQGIIVEGAASDAGQSPAYQGRVEVVNGGKIEHARCGIDVQDVFNPGGGVNTGTGGGIVHLWSDAQIKDNIIGVRYGQYSFPNRSTFNGPVLSVTDEYRGGDETPTLLQLNGIKGLHIRNGHFQDLRTQCPSPSKRATGIDALSSGFRVSLSSSFEDLYRGIRANNLNESNGSLFLSESRFLRCYKGIELKSSGSFVITGNTFIVKKPDACAPQVTIVKGVEISDKTTGFDFSRNNFYYDEPEKIPLEILIGTDCIALGTDMDNIIFKNAYSYLTIGNRASGNNGNAAGGLLYLCNTNQNLKTDFLIAGGSIRKTQGEMGLPAGNVFSVDTVCTIVNNGATIDYFFYDGDTRQTPGMATTLPGSPCSSITGFETQAVNHPNGNCADPDTTCFPCPEPHLAEWKTRFFENRQQWQTQKAAFPFMTGEQQRAAAADTIRRLRLAMNRDGSRILMHYSLDTLSINVDSITRWLALAETYSTDLRLARHYFFTGDYPAFDSLWSFIPSRYDLDESSEDELTRLGEVYDTLRTHLSIGIPLEKLPQPTLETLKGWALNCDEPGFLSEVILWRNGVEQSQDCSGDGSRSVTTISEPPNNFQEQYLKIYPNPVVSSFCIHSNERVQVVRLWDASGKLILQEQAGASPWCTNLPENLPPGFYGAELLFEDGRRMMRKVVVVKR